MLERTIRVVALSLVAAACGPGTPTVELEFREGTLMEVVPSPDGSRLALQLWSHIWIVDAEGGEARRLTDPIDPPDEHWSPRWSPDGGSIVYSALRTGAGLVVVPATGGLPELLTDGEFDSSPSWSPDGGTIVFGRGSGLWTIPSAGGEPQRLTPDTLQASAPAWSPDGNWIAFSSNGRLHLIAPDDESIREVTAGPEDGYPSWSAPGTELYFLSSRSGSQQIWSVSLDGGTPRQLSDDEDVYPYAPRWMSGRNVIVYAAGGRIRTLDPASGTRDSIPFVARVSFPQPTYVRTRPEIPRGGTRVPVRGIGKPAPSPDGRHIAFAALGDLWLRDADGRTAQLTSGPADDGDAAWSPDGRAIAFVSDADGDYQLYVLDLATRERRRVTDDPGQVEHPLWHPSGDSIVFVQRTRPNGRPELKMVAATGDANRPLVQVQGVDAHPLGWAAGDQGLLFSQLSFDPSTFEISTSIMHYDGDGAHPLPEEQQWGQLDFVAVSRDGQRMSYVDRGELWIGSPASDSVARRVGTHATFFPAWSADGNIVYVSGGKLRQLDVATGADRDLRLNLTYEVPRPTGTLLVRNARLLTPEPREGMWDLFLSDGLIQSIRPSGGQTPEADSVLDVEGRTVMPGLFDIHAHIFRGVFTPEGYLYWGVTSIGDAGGEGHWTVQQQEAIESGRRAGPRIFPAGGFVVTSHMNAFPQFLRVDSEEQLERHLDHLAGLGATQVKHYLRRDPWVGAATVRLAHRRGLPVLSHFITPAAVAAGLDRKEHAFYAATNGVLTTHYRQDVLEILREARITLTPTLAFAGTPLDSLGSERVQPDFSDPEVVSFLPPAAAEVAQQRHARRAQQAGSSEPPDRLRAMLGNAGAARDAGVRIATGTDWQPGYLALHWELALLVEAGLTPLEAIRAATENAALALGVEGRLGSIEEGAVADLLILDADPLQNIRNTQKIYAVLKNGRLVDREKLLIEARAKNGGR